MMVKDDINLIYSIITVYKVNVLMLLLMYTNAENKGKQNWLLLEFPRFLWAIEMRLYDNWKLSYWKVELSNWKLGNPS